MERCGWSLVNPLMIEYHDKEWGVPVFDDRKIFEFIVLDSFQAGAQLGYNPFKKGKYAPGI